MDAINVSVVICTTGRYASLMETIESLNNQTYRPYEVIVVDQNTSEESQLVMGVRNNYAFLVRYFRVGFRSLARGRNYGIDLITDSKWILFLDDDVWLSETYLEALIDGVHVHKDAKVVFGVIDNLSSSPRMYNLFAEVVKLPYHAPNAGFRVMSSFKTSMDTNVTHDIPADWATGCGFMVHRDLFKTIRFDASLVSYSFNEDTDFSFRVSRTISNSVWCIAGARLKHFETPSHRIARKRLTLMRTLYEVYFFYKNERYGLRLRDFLLSEISYTLAIATAALIRYPSNPYSFSSHLKSYLYVLKYRRQIVQGDLSEINSFLANS